MRLVANRSGKGSVVQSMAAKKSTYARHCVYLALWRSHVLHRRKTKADGASSGTSCGGLSFYTGAKQAFENYASVLPCGGLLFYTVARRTATSDPITVACGGLLFYTGARSRHYFQKYGNMFEDCYLVHCNNAA